MQGSEGLLIKIQLIHPKARLPSYASIGAAGADIFAALDDSLVIGAGKRTAVPTGIKIELPEGYEAQVRPRSGLAIKSGITVLNAPGTIDSDYRGELLVLLVNLSDKDYTINCGDRIAQIIIAPVMRVSFSTARVLLPSKRGDGGFGSTGR